MCVASAVVGEDAFGAAHDAQAVLDLGWVVVVVVVVVCRFTVCSGCLRFALANAET